jgi:glycosyltransferase involved in cell wall biosynthesis
VAWLIALAWFARAMEAVRGLPAIPDLLLPEFDVAVGGDAPRITVIVPARNEERDIAATLESLLAQDCPRCSIVAVDDRSTDATGSVMQRLATAHPEKLRVLTVAELPSGWLGKTHAMAKAARVATAELEAEFLLFTDADVLFRPDAVRRTLANVAATEADHFVLFPTLIIRHWGEAALISFFQVLGLWFTRPWRVANPRAKRDAVGIGAFNLVRVSAYERLGGFESLRMEIVEDLALARRVKELGLRQRVAFGNDLVRVHWASGVRGIVNVLTKNLFTVFRYSPALAVLGCAGIAMTTIVPFGAVIVHGFMLPAAVAIGSILTAYVVMSRRTGIPAWNGLLAPFSAAVIIYATLRSAFITLRQGGVIWRGTFYSLAELRRSLPPLLRTR